MPELALQSDVAARFVKSILPKSQLAEGEGFLACCLSQMGSLYTWRDQPAERVAADIARWSRANPNAYMSGGIFRVDALEPAMKADGSRLRYGGRPCRGRAKENLVGVHLLMADVDYASILAHYESIGFGLRDGPWRPHEGGQARGSWQRRKDELNAEIRFWPDDHLNTHLARGVEELREALHVLTLADATIVCSGYGLYPILPIAEEDLRRVDEACDAQRAFVRALNEIVGYPLADPGASDAGTRLWRMPGAWNLKSVDKGAIPRLARVIHEGSTKRHRLDDLLELLDEYKPDRSSAGEAARLPTPIELPAGADLPSVMEKHWGAGRDWSRHDFIWSAAAVFARKGVPEDAAGAMLRDLAARCGDSDYAGEKTTGHVREAYQRVASGAPARGLTYLSRHLLDEAGVASFLGFIDSLDVPRPPPPTDEVYTEGYDGPIEDDGCPGEDVDRGDAWEPDYDGTVGDALYNRELVWEVLEATGHDEIARGLGICESSSYRRRFVCDKGHVHTRPVYCHRSYYCPKCAYIEGRKVAERALPSMSDNLMLARLRFEGDGPVDLLRTALKAASLAVARVKPAPNVKLVRTGHSFFTFEGESHLEVDLIIDYIDHDLADIHAAMERLQELYEVHERKDGVRRRIVSITERLSREAAEAVIVGGLSHVSPWVMDTSLVSALAPAWRGRKRHRFSASLAAMIEREETIGVPGEEHPVVPCKAAGCDEAAELVAYQIDLDQVYKQPAWRRACACAAAAARQRSYARGHTRLDCAAAQAGVDVSIGWGELERVEIDARDELALGRAHRPLTPVPT